MPELNPVSDVCDCIGPGDSRYDPEASWRRRRILLLNEKIQQQMADALETCNGNE